MLPTQTDKASTVEFGSILAIGGGACCCLSSMLLVVGVIFFLVRGRSGGSDGGEGGIDAQLSEDFSAGDSPFASSSSPVEPIARVPEQTPRAAPQAAGPGVPPPLPSGNIPDPSMPRSTPRPTGSGYTGAPNTPPPLPNSPLPPPISSTPNRTIVPFDLDEPEEDAATVLFTRPTDDE
jgi:hypothetical protein